MRSQYLGCNHAGWWVAVDEIELAEVAGLATGISAEEVATVGALPAPYGRYYLAPDRIAAAQANGPTRAEQLQELEARLLAAYASASDSDGMEAPPRRGAVWYSKAVVPFFDGVVERERRPRDPRARHRRLVAGNPGGRRRGTAPPTSPCRACSSLARRQRCRRLPAAILASHAAYEALVVEALATGAPRRALVRALAANPMVHDLDRAAGLVDAILAGSPRG